jgi:membrane-bound serine protease (ClpP class)
MNIDKGLKINFYMNIYKILGLVLLGLMQTWQVIAQSTPKAAKVFVMKIHAEIDPRMTRYVNLAIAEANSQRVDYIILDLNTYGGRVDDADEIVKQLLDYKKPIYAFVNHNAASAGAWIAIACDKIYMVKNATMGAASVVSGEGRLMPEKYQSFMRGKMRATAEANGRNPRIAEAMVDGNVVAEGVNEAGKIITFTTAEAIQHQYCEGTAQTIAEVLKQNQLENASIQYFELSAIEQLILFFLNPYISGLLLTLIIGGIWMELKMPGTVFPIAVSMVAGALYLMPYYLTGLAENWEIGLFIIGVVLLAVEIFIIPGFGVVGFSGLSLMLGSLVLMMIHNRGFDFQWVANSDIFQALLSAGLSVLLAIGMMFTLIPRILNSSRFKQISLQSALHKEEGFVTSNADITLPGKSGVAQTVLRPSGKVLIDNILYDAITTGKFVEKDTPIVVISQEGNTIKVKPKGD